MAQAKVLYLSSNADPDDLLALDEEFHDLKNKVEILDQAFADSLDYRPNFVPAELPGLLLRGPGYWAIHFSGHGDEDGNLTVRGGDGVPTPCDPEKLFKVVSAAGSGIRVAILVACYSEKNAAALLELGLDVVIGVPEAIKDDPARCFVVALYEMLCKRSVGHAFDAAKAVMQSSYPTADVVISVREGVDRYSLAAPHVALARSDVPRGEAAVTGPFQAPRPPANFVGRVEELAQLEQLLSQTNALVAIRAATGGEGKTALAAATAARLRHRFPDGVLWARLDLEPIESVLESFVSALAPDGMQANAAARGREALARSFRSLASRRRCLVVLDNVEHGSQIEPLLPGSGHAAVLVTTRFALADSLASPPVEVKVRPLDDEAFASLMTSLVARPFSAEEAESLRRLRTALGGLPLAAKLAAGVIYENGWSVDEYVTRLAASQTLEWLGPEGGEPMRKSFSLSFAALRNPVAEECFVVIGLLGNLPVSERILAAATGRPTAAVERALVTLVMRGMLERRGQAPNEYSVHPLMARYAYERAVARDVTAYHVALAKFCREQLTQWNPVGQRFSYGGVGKPADAMWGVGASRHYLDAGAVADAEAVLVATADILTLQGHEQTLMDLIDEIEPKVPTLEPWLRIYRAGFVASGRDPTRPVAAGQATLNELCSCSDPKVASSAWIYIAKLETRAGNYAAAEGALAESAKLKSAINPPDRKGLAFIRNEQARLLTKSRGDYPAAAGMHHEAYELQRELGDEKGMAYSLWRRGSIELWHLNDVAKAESTFEEALRRAGAAGSKLIYGEALLRLAEVRQRQERYRVAHALLLECRALADEGDNPLLRAKVHKELGALYDTVEHHGRARDELRRAFELFEQLGDHEDTSKLKKTLARVEAKCASLHAERSEIVQKLAKDVDIESSARTVLQRRLKRLNELLDLLPAKAGDVPKITLGKPD